jgi:short-subunit dehydrogenase
LLHERLQEEPRMRMTHAGVGFGAAALALLALRRLGHLRHDPRLRHAVVTGGSRGLGFAIAEELLTRGIRVSICGRDEDTLARAERELRDLGEVRACQADLAEREEVDRFLREAHGAHGPVDLLVNNAAVIQVGPLETTVYDDYEKILRINFLAPVRLALAVLPEMRDRRFGRIVNVCSVGGRLPVPHLLPYTASKFALTGFSEGLRAELAGTGVGVTTVCAGLTRTGSPRHVEFRGRPRAEHAWFAVGDSLPVLSGDARRTARRIVSAALRGDADLVTTLPAHLAASFHGVFPGLTADLLGVANRFFLPRPDGGGSARGRDSGSRWAPSVLTLLGDRAGRELNQEPADDAPATKEPA